MASPLYDTCNDNRSVVERMKLEELQEARRNGRVASIHRVGDHVAALNERSEARFDWWGVGKDPRPQPGVVIPPHPTLVESDQAWMEHRIQLSHWEAEYSRSWARSTGWQFTTAELLPTISPSTKQRMLQAQSLVAKAVGAVQLAEAQLAQDVRKQLKAEPTDPASAHIWRSVEKETSQGAATRNQAEELMLDAYHHMSRTQPAVDAMIASRSVRVLTLSERLSESRDRQNNVPGTSHRKS